MDDIYFYFSSQEVPDFIYLDVKIQHPWVDCVPDIDSFDQGKLKMNVVVKILFFGNKFKKISLKRPFANTFYFLEKVFVLIKCSMKRVLG